MVFNLREYPNRLERPYSLIVFTGIYLDAGVLALAVGVPPLAGGVLLLDVFFVADDVLADVVCFSDVLLFFNVQ